MNYSDQIANIKDGDLISVLGTGVIDDITSLVTRSQYDHSAIAIWLDDVLWVSQMVPTGNDLVPLSQYPNFDVFDCPVDRVAIRKQILQSTQVFIRYSWWDFIVAGVYSLLKIKLNATKTGQICSSMVYNLYKSCGWSVVCDSTPTPAWDASQLTLKTQVRS